MKKKLLIFYPNIKNDGCKKTLELYCQQFLKRFEITLLTNTINNTLLKKLNSKINIVNPKNVFFKKNFLLNEIFCIFYFLKFRNRDKIIFSLDGHFFLLLLKLFKFKFKLIIRIANPILVNNWRLFSTDPGLKIGRLDLMLMRYANLVILYKKEHLKILYNKFNIKNSLLIRNYFPQKKSLKKRVQKKYNIAFVGRLVENKDPIFFLENCLRLNKNLYSKIFIIGSGPLLKDLKIISRKHSHKVKFIKFIKDPFKSFHNKINLFCLTSKYDGTPNVLGEAISYKIPCLAPKNVGCSNELLDIGKGGELYRLGDKDNFLSKINLIFKNYNKAIKKADKAYKGLNKYNKINTLDKLENKIYKI